MPEKKRSVYMDNSGLAKSDKKRTIMIGIAVTVATVALILGVRALRYVNGGNSYVVGRLGRWKGNLIGMSSYGVYLHCSTPGDVVVPQKIDGVPVTRVSLSGNAITSVSLPDSVTSLNVHCSSLTEIKIPDSVREIGDNAFSGCKSLSSVEFPENLFSIGRYAFEDCTSLKSIYIPKVFYIGDGAFSGCSSLTDIYIPNGVEYLADRTFQNCPSLQTISVPGTIQIEYTNERGFAPEWLPHVSRRWSN